MKPEFSFNKKIYIFIVLCFGFCIWAGLIYFENRPPPRHPPVNVKRSEGSLDDRPSGPIRPKIGRIEVDFDSNLPNLRRKIQKIFRSSHFNDSAYDNPSALYRKSDTNNLDSLSKADVLSTGVRRRLNLYRWNDFCSVDTNLLKSIPGFPFNPKAKSTLSTLNTKFSEENLGQRIFGYLIPPVSGTYSFSVASSSSLELWFSYYPNPSHARLIASVCDSQLKPVDCPSLVRKEKSIPNYLSDTLRLTADTPYYIEILSVHTESTASIEVKWRKPEADTYTDISSKCFVTFTKEQTSVIPESYHPSPPYPAHRLHRPHEPTSARDILFRYPRLPLTEFSGSIPKCNYLSDEIKNTLSNKFTVPYLSVYPDDQSEIMNIDDVSPGNTILLEKEAMFIADSFLEQIAPSIPKISLHKIVNIEKYQHQHPVTRYLIEILVYIGTNAKELYAISENFFSVSSPSINLCQHKVFRREETPFVHIMVGVKNMAYWARDLVENVERIYEETGDEKFSLVIVDFQSADINLEILLRQSKLKHWMLIEVQGGFLRSGGINLALDQIQTPDIFFTADLTLGVPLNILDLIRKRTFQGYSAYAPVVVRQMCGHTYLSPLGYWEVMGYGLMGMYKSDWVRVGGMNSVDFQNKWGGEDWFCADAILANGINLNRIKERNFYHHYHSKAGLWEGK